MCNESVCSFRMYAIWYDVLARAATHCGNATRLASTRRDATKRNTEPFSINVEYIIRYYVILYYIIL